MSSDAGIGIGACGANGNCTTRVSAPMSLKMLIASSVALLPMFSIAITDEQPMTIPSNASSERRPSPRRLARAS